MFYSSLILTFSLEILVMKLLMPLMFYHINIETNMWWLDASEEYINNWIVVESMENPSEDTGMTWTTLVQAGSCVIYMQTMFNLNSPVLRLNGRPALNMQKAY